MPIPHPNQGNTRDKILSLFNASRKRLWGSLIISAGSSPALAEEELEAAPSCCSVTPSSLATVLLHAFGK
jgi:hypothetical protein